MPHPSNKINKNRLFLSYFTRRSRVIPIALFLSLTSTTTILYYQGLHGPLFDSRAVQAPDAPPVSSSYPLLRLLVLSSRFLFFSFSFLLLTSGGRSTVLRHSRQGRSERSARERPQLVFVCVCICVCVCLYTYT